MYIFVWNDGNPSKRYSEAVVHHENVVSLARVFNGAGYYFKVLAGTEVVDQSEFGRTDIDCWLKPGDKFPTEA